MREPLTPDPSEIAWHGWLRKAELHAALGTWLFVPDGVDALRRHPGLGSPAAATPWPAPPPP
ncbi:hypothetical protein AB0K68_23720 [Streptomyces sp. NPDC050698]